MFEGKNIVIQANVLEATSRGAILEIAFHGVHDHLWPDGEKIHRFVRDAVQRVNPAAILFNFVDYHYEWGNEIGGQILGACLDEENHRFRPFAVVAEGFTAKRLKSLLLTGNLQAAIPYEFFRDTESARAFLKRTIGAAA